MSVEALAPIRNSQLEEYFRFDNENDAALSGLKSFVRSINRRPNLTNEYSIALPPPPTGCMESCPFKKGKHRCELTEHHLHSTVPDYEAAGDLAIDFRELSVLTVWLPECVHHRHHMTFDIHVHIPSEKVMKWCIHEQKIIRNVVDISRRLRNTEKGLAEAAEAGKESFGLDQAKERFIEELDDALVGIQSIEVIPEELVTGALLVAAPEHAQARIARGSGVALTRTMTIKEVPLALSNLEAAMAEAA
ncbi:MAG: hypothetical protein WD877_00985 [Candidatus Saccharimonadales bacterium]